MLKHNWCLLYPRKAKVCVYVHECAETGIQFYKCCCNQGGQRVLFMVLNSQHTHLEMNLLLCNKLKLKMHHGDTKWGRDLTAGFFLLTLILR